MSGSWIDLEGAHNARELGGLPTSGGTTRSGVLLRSDALDLLTVRDVELLQRDWELAHVVDLRSATERGGNGRGLLGATGVRYSELDVIGPDDLARRSTERMAEFASGRPAEEIMAAGYVELATLGAGAYVEAFRRILEPSGSPVLVHCAAGKDRTGVFVALLLDAVGVDRGAIISDYAATNDRMAPIIERLGASASYERPTARYPAFVMEAVAPTMERFIDEIDRRWQSGAGYFAAHGVGDADLDRWRDLFVAG